MITLIECESSWYRTNFVICPKCKCRAGYHSRFGNNTKISFKCKCNKTLTQIKKEEKNVRN